MYRTTARLLVMFILLNLVSYKQAFRDNDDMKWKRHISKAWPPVTQNHRYVYRISLIILNVPNYLDNGLEKTFVTTGILLDNSRILTSYNPYRKLLGNSNFTDNLVAGLVVGIEQYVTTVRIASIVCARQIAYVPDEDSHIWNDHRHSPLHDLMVLRLEAEFGVARMSYRYYKYITTFHHFYWAGELGKNFNSLVSFPAGPFNQIDTKVRIFTIGYRDNKTNEANYLKADNKTREKNEDFDYIHEIYYDEDDSVLEDCDEYLPRQWGFFICVRNIEDFPGITSGAVLFSNNKVFGIGSFALFKNDTSVLVFTDVRPYKELIKKTCGDEEFA